MSDTSSNQEDTRSVHQYAQTQDLPEVDYPREERDVAFAAELLGARHVTERQLSVALSSWTIHGTVSLADHIGNSGLLPADVKHQLELQAADKLEQLKLENVGADAANADSLRLAILEKLDEHGRVARLLGIGVPAASGDDTSRRVSARYRLLRKLGQGGLGTVWLAHDVNLQRNVALKEISSVEVASQGAMDRFRREAEVTGRLAHPGIVPVHQLGEDDETGRTFYTMRFLGKQTLHDSIQEYHDRRAEGDYDPMLLRRLLTSFVNICQAMGHAHARKVIHRDLKPENVAIDNFGQVIVIDWGLAKVLDDEGLGDVGGEWLGNQFGESERTMAGQVLGTPLYMAPEQAAGRIDEVDQRTDIYGLGAILFAILTGVAPHEKSQANSSVNGTRGLITEIVSRPTPLARAENPDVDPALEAICAKAMAKRRYARHQTASELADDVQRWMAGEPVSAYQERLSQRFGRWVQNHRLLSQLLAGLLTVSLVAAFTLAIAQRQNRAAAQAARFDELRDQAREIELQLEAAARDVEKDVRFMSTLPPIQNIINVRRSESPSIEGEDEATWRQRLETIYEGLLRANSNYLSVVYVGLSSNEAQEIVRVERNMTDPAYIRKVPQSRLSVVENEDVVQQVMQLEPGEVQLAIEQRLTGRTDRKRLRRRLLAAVPVYDEKTGDAFGMVAIQTDFTEVIRSILSSLNTHASEIYVTDAGGAMWVTSLPGVGVEVAEAGKNVNDIAEETRAFFADSGSDRLANYEQGYVVQRVPLDDSDAETSMGIFLRISPER